MLIVLEKMRASQAAADQRQFEKASPNHNIRKLAQQIWTKFREAPNDDESFGWPPDSRFGKGFLGSFYPTYGNAKKNVLEALVRWYLYFDGFNGHLWGGHWRLSSGELANQILNVKSNLWTDKWQPNGNVEIYRICPGPSVDDPFNYDKIDGDVVQQMDECKPEVQLPFSTSLCSASRTNIVACSFIARTRTTAYEAGSAA